MIDIKIDFEPELDYITKRLGVLKNKAPSVLAKALNQTAKEARKKLQNKAKETYVVKAGKFNKAMKIKNANAGRLEATLKARGKKMALSDFKINPKGPTSQKGGNRSPVGFGKNLKSGAMKNLSKGDKLKSFVVAFSSGHVAIVRRTGQRTSSGKEGLKEFKSLSVPQMIGSERRVYGIVRPDIEDSLRKYVNQQIDKLLEAK